MAKRAPPEVRKAVPQPKAGELPELRRRSPLSWNALQDLQLRHDLDFHKDVMASSPAYQLRHCIMHLNKVLGNVSALTEKSFHGESINEAALDLAERRLPDLQAFVFKIASLADLRLSTEFSHFGMTLQQASQGSAHEEMDIEWLEARLVRFEEAMAIFTKLHAPLMDRPTIPPVMRAEIKAALLILQAVAIDLAHYLQVDLDRNYRDRLLAVEHRKLA